MMDEANGLVFSAHVDYVQPSYKELSLRFPGGVDPNFHYSRLMPTDRCARVSQAAREREFRYIHFDRPARFVEYLDETHSQKSRPAIFEELLAFAEWYPEERNFPIIAAGSFMRLNRVNYVPFIWRDISRGRCLMLLKSTPRRLQEACRFLAVPDQSLDE